MDYLVVLIKIDLEAYCANISIGEWVVYLVCNFLLVCLMNHYCWKKCFGLIHNFVLAICSTFIVGVTILGREDGMETSSIYTLFSTYEQTFVEGAVHVGFEILFNMALFVPAGICLSLKNSNKQVIRDLFLFSLVIEVIQLFTGRGVFELADVINNVLGGVAGMLIVNLVRKFESYIGGGKEKCSTEKHY